MKDADLKKEDAQMITMAQAVKAKKIKQGVYRITGNLILVRRAGRCLSHSVVTVTKRCYTWKLFKTSLNDQEVVEVLEVSGTRNMFGAAVAGEFETKAEAAKAIAAAIVKEAR